MTLRTWHIAHAQEVLPILPSVGIRRECVWGGRESHQEEVGLIPVFMLLTSSKRAHFI